jgi:hypothetical protein
MREYHHLKIIVSATEDGWGFSAFVAENTVAAGIAPSLSAIHEMLEEVLFRYAEARGADPA